MEPLEDEFGDIIQKARGGLGLTIKQVAERADIASTLLEEMESCRRLPSEEEVVAISSVLNLDAVKLQAIAMGLWHPEDLSSDKLSGIMIIDGSIGSYKVKGYILVDLETGEAAAFDTANDSRKVLNTLQKKGLRLKYIFLTHCHADHTGGLREIHRATSGGVGIPEGEPTIELEKDIRRGVSLIKNGSEFDMGQYRIKAIATPGHTYGSTCYIAENYCFSGDTLFAGSVGRAYSAEGYRRLLNAVKTRILTLKEDVLIFPGHGPATTVGEEISHNPFF